MTLCTILSGVNLTLNGETIPNDSYVLVTDISVYNSSLHCHTDRSGCCRGIDAPDGAAQGHWYRPNGTQVRSFALEEAINFRATRNFFYRNRGVGVVRLNRIGTPPERGRFCCEVPNADGANVTVYVNIGE